MKSKSTVVLFVGLILLIGAVPPSYSLDFSLGKDVHGLIKGDVTYTMRIRTQNPDYYLLYSPLNKSTGNSNFKVGDLVNNKPIVRWEAQGFAPHLTLFARGEAFYDNVFNDDKFNWETRRHAEYNFLDAIEYYLEGKFFDDKFTFRVGRQVVQWGESLAPVFAVAVNTVSPVFGARVAAAGYTFRDYQVPSLMLWTNYEPVPTWSIEAVWNPDFDPRYAMPVVGTFQSFSDAFGFGQDGSIDDRRPKKFEDQQQYGVSIRKSFPSLRSFELGFYYYHHLDRSPSISTDLQSLLALKTPVATYEEIDMYGMSFAHTIDKIGNWDLGLQINGELAYRPDDTLQKNLIVKSPLIASQVGVEPGGSVGPIGGFDSGKTLNWVFGGSRLFSDVLPFTPWTCSLTTMYEFYGSVNLDYSGSKHYADPESTYYYFVALPLSTADLLDNSTVTLEVDATGNLHHQQISLHRFSYSLKVKYGDHLEALVGYDMPIGDPKESVGPNNMPDRDQLTFTLTWYFI
jgi:hypothetical protein